MHGAGAGTALPQQRPGPHQWPHPSWRRPVALCRPYRRSRFSTGLILGLSLLGASLPVDAPGASCSFVAGRHCRRRRGGVHSVFFSTPLNMLPWPVAWGMLAHALRWVALTVFGFGRRSRRAGRLHRRWTDPHARSAPHAYAICGHRLCSVVSMMPGVYLFRMTSGLVELAGGSQPTLQLISETIADGMTANDHHPGDEFRPHHSEDDRRLSRQPTNASKNHGSGRTCQRSLEVHRHIRKLGRLRADEHGQELSRLEARLPALLSVIRGEWSTSRAFLPWAIFSPPMSPAILWLLPLRRCMAVRSIRRKSWLFPSLWWPWRPLADRPGLGPTRTEPGAAVALGSISAAPPRCLIFSIITRPSADPQGVAAGHCRVMVRSPQWPASTHCFALAIPGAISTAVMTGNLTNTVLSLMDLLSKHRALLQSIPAA